MANYQLCVDPMRCPYCEKHSAKLFLRKLTTFQILGSSRLQIMSLAQAAQARRDALRMLQQQSVAIRGGVPAVPNYCGCGEPATCDPGLCQTCFDERAIPCYNCKTNMTAFPSKLCGRCFSKNLFKCSVPKCGIPIGQPGKCKACYRKSAKKCSVCGEVTHTDSGICKKCTPRVCETCNNPIEKGRKCVDCFQKAKGRKLCSDCNINYTEHDLCTTCYHISEGHVLCIVCGLYYSEFKNGICKSCHHQNLFNCDWCGVPQGNPGTCKSCRTPVVAIVNKPQKCEFYSVERGHKVECARMASNGKYCDACYALLQHYQIPGSY